ncbi:MAG TPA: SPOR domain-containing protein [Bacteroidia bacterium]|nr:SPOR domain-containing protein [Bacteroidia bacterium]
MKVEVKKIDPFVGELLYDHDCVIITDFGGFVASYRPASLNTALHVLSPPSKKIAFNASLKTNDGLLANHIASRTGMSYPEACDTIRNYVNEALRNIEGGKKLVIEQVGSLYLDAQKNLRFAPDNKANFLIDSFGFGPVHTPAIKRNQGEVQLSRKRNPVVKTLPVRTKKESGRRIGILEMIPAAAILAIMFITPPALEQFNAQLSHMLPFSRMNEVFEELKGSRETHSQMHYVLPSPFLIPKGAKPEMPKGSWTVTPVPADTTSVKHDRSTVWVDGNPENITDQAAVVAVPETGGITENTTTSWVIGGSFRNRNNADIYAAELRNTGINAQVLGFTHNGYYLVSLFGSDQTISARQALEEYKNNKFPDAWMFTR